ncbi:hypothetical protein ACE4RU_10875 [Actinobacillus seminis]|uniref:phage baseplate plug family protein n=1 Tax=Actinobacillus seminis TaxID=722 RepID=UPI003B9570F6
MIYEIPLKNVPNQKLSTSINGQLLEIGLMTRLNENLYISVAVDGVDIVHNRLCRDRTALIGVDYLNIKGELAFVDIQGRQDPHYSALKERYKLIFIERAYG